ncbi:hypothetical protein PR202_gb08590 [Eleusine coracana subsp. coracana]|uniref:non-specific serine/threonine protein kinase n=1 Tax=Eleusine coracana subsp. coracana TaxID=191504 RepID=A0AAV5EEZ9_ELECO|nr:hypothetical protein PR202_gb08590 [Eleusine coracana subsp. coracana]
MLMENLQNLDLHDNLMVGPIPNEVGMLISIVELHLDNNKFFGSMPLGIGNLSRLQRLTLSYNNLSSSIPYSLWHLDNFIQLDLSHNSLSGKLPSDIGLMRAIAQDSIPDSLGKLTSIVTLDLSDNSLSGNIPKSLANLSYLAYLNLSFNKLEGQIPAGGIFSNIAIGSLVGNRALCGLSRLEFSPCANSSRSKLNILKYVLPSMAAFVIVIICLSLKLKGTFSKKQKEESAPPADGVNHMLDHEIIRATSNFSEENLIGVGSFGRVFKGQLSHGMTVAIKVFNMELERASRSFDAECQALCMARHRNLVRILSTCSNQDFKALMLQYMPNGSLETLLHSEGRPPLGFLKRIGILLDVAMALEYLHHHHFDLILHCDLKPSNVLLDEEFTAHLADFGIAKLLLGDDTSIITASMPGTIGYMAPEYGSMGRASRKSDVFSYGIMLLEVITGKRPTDPAFVAERSLRQQVNDAFRTQIFHVIDPNLLMQEKLGGFGDIGTTSRSSSDTLNSCLVSVVELGLLCTSELPEKRISMTDVVKGLTKIKTEYTRMRNE